MAYIVKAEQTEPLILRPSTTVEEVLQNVRVIISTIRGEVPLDRPFGLEGKFLDKPINIAQPILVTEVLEAIETYEPRARVLSINFDDDPDVPGKLIPYVEVEVVDE